MEIVLVIAFFALGLKGLAQFGGILLRTRIGQLLIVLVAAVLVFSFAR